MMMLGSSLLILLALLTSGVESWQSLRAQSPKMKSRTVKNTVQSTLAFKAQQQERGNRDAWHEVVFAVKNRNMDELEAILQDVANPKKPKSYLRYWSRDEIAAFTHNDAAVTEIKQFCQQNGIEIKKETKYSDFITASAPLSTWEQVLNTQFHVFSVEHFATGETKYLHRALEYTLPATLSSHVEHIFNVVQIPPAAQKHMMINYYRSPSKESVAAMRADYTATADEFTGDVTPSLLNSYYNITNNTGNALVSQSVYESLNQTTSPTDLTIFQETFNLPLQGLAGDYNGHVSDIACEFYYGDNGCLEANLDVQYMMGIAQNIPTYYYYWGGEDFLLDWVTQVQHYTN